MSRPRTSRLVVIAAVLTVATAPARAGAQFPIPTLSVLGGVSQYHLTGGSGSAPMGSVRLDIPLFVIVAEGSLSGFRPNELGAARTTLIPEVQLQYQLFPAVVRPYLGFGAGWFRAIHNGAPQPDGITLSGSAGVRVGIPLTGIGLRAEVRARGVGSSFSGHAVEYMAGLSF